jgi:hypothetical protein
MRFSRIIVATLGIVGIAAAASPVRADWDGDGGWRRRAWQEQHWRVHHWHAYPPPYVYYAPPPVYYYAPPPPPVYVAPGLSVGVTIPFR